ncbi:MAG: hypothetical protein HC831_01265 [Chloroflexia bacterium]|nr:hypothetical protein [Chloroflexia bacterium]
MGVRSMILSILDIKSSVTEIAVSPDGSEIAFVYRGDVFVTSADYSTSKQITSTPEQERSVSFSPDGKAILYAGEKTEAGMFTKPK